ncbi:hypothetical protein GCM10009069_23930 [Algimonas arctica]|uniref:VWFA domain-containing protein n=1 Tax=Algimonas arctica TaxID=1479486 RepID=A0A8J3G313_9PROT|nr:pilus assembly protein TadG-related protein [Algimonas arctica]GHB00379.1 hypothetical protein GCM10009069_23930 [Algimonas arctica]
MKFNHIHRFAKNEDGNIAMMFSISLMVILAMFGGAIDFTMKTSAQSRSQDIADAVALSVAAFVRLNDFIPAAGSAEGTPPGDYPATYFGYEFQGWVEGGADNVNVNVSYDEVGREATVTVTGKTVTTFANVMGMDSLNFSTKSVVNFETVEIKDVASVTLVLDNSGSMAWDDKPYTTNSHGSLSAPSGAMPRITALENSVMSFMDHLEPLVGDQSETGKRVFRSGIIPYDTDVNHSRKQPMDWQILSNSDITAMTANGGTNSSRPMKTAGDWIIGETAVHRAETGKSPLRYVVLMSDGANNNNSSAWISETGTEEWRRKRCRNYKNYGWSCWYDYKSKSHKPNDKVGYWNNGNRYDYDWEEGRWTLPDDEETLVQCRRIKDDGVKIYTIGFGLEPGKYDTNSSYGSTTTITSDETDQAYALLSECASDPTMFITANSAEELQSAFDSIGEDIVTETIRIRS